MQLLRDVFYSISLIDPRKGNKKVSSMSIVGPQLKIPPYKNHGIPQIICKSS